VNPKGVEVPVAVTAFPNELYQTPRSWVEKANPNLVHYNKVNKGGHFAAWEEPMLLSKDLWTAFDRCVELLIIERRVVVCSAPNKARVIFSSSTALCCATEHLRYHRGWPFCCGHSRRLKGTVGFRSNGKLWSVELSAPRHRLTANQTCESDNAKD
jgi:hypothetical protein